MSEGTTQTPEQRRSLLPPVVGTMMWTYGVPFHITHGPPLVRWYPLVYNPLIAPVLRFRH